MSKVRFINSEEQILSNAQSIYLQIEKSTKEINKQIERRNNKYLKETEGNEVSINENVEISKANNNDYKIIDNLIGKKIKLLEIQSSINLKNKKEDSGEITNEDFKAVLDEINNSTN